MNSGTPYFSYYILVYIMYPNDRIKMAIHIYNILHSLRKTAKLLQVSHSTISRWINNPIRKKYTTKRVLKADLIVDIIQNETI